MHEVWRPHLTTAARAARLAHPAYSAPTSGWWGSVLTDPCMHGDTAGHAGVDRPGRTVLGDRADQAGRRPGLRGEPGAFLTEEQDAVPGQVHGLDRHGTRQIVHAHDDQA